MDGLKNMGSQENCQHQIEKHDKGLHDQNHMFSTTPDKFWSVALIINDLFINMSID